MSTLIPSLRRTLTLILALALLIAPMPAFSAAPPVRDVQLGVDVAAPPIVDTDAALAVAPIDGQAPPKNINPAPTAIPTVVPDAVGDIVRLQADELTPQVEDRYGPKRNDPAMGIPDHAYSPFDELDQSSGCPDGGCEAMAGQFVLKLSDKVGVGENSLNAFGLSDAGLAASLADVGVASLEPVFPNYSAKTGLKGQTVDGVEMPDLSRWYRAKLADAKADVATTVLSLQGQSGVDVVEPDYIRRPVGGPVEARTTIDLAGAELAAMPGPGTDPLYSQQWHLEGANVPAAWAYLESEGLPAGGSPDVIVAVIDTGVDYTHPDLAASMWINAPEFTGTPGVDDDGNGYVDDIYGADTVYPDGDPQDDHGHGTHVAGIIAAQANNGEGGVGVAYNSQIMALKAAQYSGVLASSDIAEAIYYAVDKGADVINMSFGGYAQSTVEEDALTVAFSTSVLVAAAGNDGKVNLPCWGGKNHYPASHDWVLGVMATDPNSERPPWSNYDCTPNDTSEYELYAPGVDIWSTLPAYQYAAWDGTSMAAPVVAGIASLCRTKWSDKQAYSSRFIMGQIAANTSGSDVADAHAALTVMPAPELTFSQLWLFDTTVQSAVNDDDGILDSGETVDIAIDVRNHWGKADPVTVVLEPIAYGASTPDPYVTMIVDTVDYGAVGSFAHDDNGLIADGDGVITGVDVPFQLAVDATTPNDHVVPLKITITADNGFDPLDPRNPFVSVAHTALVVQRGTELPSVIYEDTTLTPDRYWIVAGPTLVEAGATLTVAAGTQVQWGVPDPSSPQTPLDDSVLVVHGNMRVEGNESEPVEFFPSPLLNGQTYLKNVPSLGGSTTMEYTRIRNPKIGDGSDSPNYLVDSMDHCYLDLDNAPGGSSYPAWEIACNHLQNSQLFKLRMQPLTSQGYNIARQECVLVQSLCLANQPYNDARRLWSGFGNSVFLPDMESYLNGPFFIKFRLEFSSNYTRDLASAQSKTAYRNNAFLVPLWDASAGAWPLFTPRAIWDSTYYLGMTNNYWSTTSDALIDLMIQDYEDDFTSGRIIYQPILETPAETTYPFVVNVALSQDSEDDLKQVGPGLAQFAVTFNRDMDFTQQPRVTFGPALPCSDYVVSGDWHDARTWVGSHNVSPTTGDGYQLIRVAGAVAADDPWLVTGDDAGRFRFEIITSGTESMNLQATGGEGYIDLSWAQDDFDLLSGFNMYRSDAADGTYTRINQGMIPSDVRTYRDDAVNPGQPYYYKFTVVKSDMQESDYSNVAMATPIDTVPPMISHAPVTQATPGLPLTINCDVTDNVRVDAVSLFVRVMGSGLFSERAMTGTTGDRYSATVEGSLLASPGIEYYIVASDGVSTVTHGRADLPHPVAVNDTPVVTTVSPGHGPTSGGTLVTISGSNFKAGASVTFGGAPSEDVVVLSSSQITATTPAHFPETVDVCVTSPGDVAGLLTRAYTYESDVASLGIPNAGGGQGSYVQVPINAANIDGLAAADLVVTYDASVLRANDVSVGSLTPGWSLTTNTGTPGQVVIALASTGGTVTGAGTLVVIEYEVIGGPGATGAMAIAIAELNDGAIPLDLAPGTFSVDETYSIAGAVSYWNGGADIGGVDLTLDGDRLYVGASAADGAYLMDNIAAGAYELTPSKGDEANGISALDASAVMRHKVGLEMLSGHAATAGDVDKSGTINSMDAFYILQASVGLVEPPFNGAGAVWEFCPALRSYPALASDQSGQDFTGILFGDPTGNWAPDAQQSGVGLKAGAATLTIPDLPTTFGATIQVPVQIGVTSGEVYAADLVLGYDETVLAIQSVALGSAASAWYTANNTSVAGTIRVALAGAEPLTTGGEFLVLTFQVVGDAGSSSAVSLVAASLDEGGVSCATTDGSVTVHTPVAAGFSGTPTSGIAPLSVAFTDASSGDYDTWSWDFGDGETSTEANPTHVYASKGVYAVSLTVSGPGGTDVETKTEYVTVHEGVAAGFSGTPTSGIAPLSVAFTDASSGDFDTWSWDFGDGATSAEANPTHEYAIKGVYTVQLTVSGPGGTETETKTDYITVNLGSIGGSATYWSDSEGVGGVVVAYDGPVSGSTVSATDGSYTASDLTRGDYGLTPAKADDAEGITAYDASLCLQHAVDNITLADYAALAGDVTKNGDISALDASQILQYAVGNIALPFPDAGEIWEFDPSTRDVDGLEGDVTGQDFTAVLLGDVSGNWREAAGLSANAPGLKGDSATLSASDLAADAGSQVVVPIDVSVSAGELYAVDLRVIYDEAVLEFVAINRGAHADNWALASNADVAGELDVAFAGFDPLVGDGELLLLTFSVIGQAGDSSPVTLLDVSLNEGRIDAAAIDGSVYVNAQLAMMSRGLDEGWNLISFDLAPQLSGQSIDAVAQVLDSVDGRYDAVLGYDQGAQSYYPQLPPQFSDLQAMDYLHGYWIKMTEFGLLAMSGAYVDNDHPIQLSEGWNLVSFLPDESITVADALSSIDGQYTAVRGYDGGGQSYYPELPPQFCDLKCLQVNHGYWINATSAVTLTYPTSGTCVGMTGLSAYESTPSDRVTATNEWCDVYSLASECEQSSLPTGSIVEAFDPDGVLCGMARVQVAGHWGVMHVYGDDSATAEIDEGAVTGDVLSFKVNGSKSSTVAEALWYPRGLIQVSLRGNDCGNVAGLPLLYK